MMMTKPCWHRINPIGARILWYLAYLPPYTVRSARSIGRLLHIHDISAAAALQSKRVAHVGRDAALHL